MPKFWKKSCFCQKENQEIASTNKTKKSVHSYKVIATEKVLEVSVTKSTIAKLNNWK